MAGIRVAVVIEATPAEVWKVVEPIERHVDWMHDAVAIRFTSEQTCGVGTEFLCDTKVGPIRLVDRMEITQWEAPAVMGVRHSGIVKGDGHFLLQAIDPVSPGGRAPHTLFVWQETLVFPWWLGGPVGAFIGGGLVLRAIWKRNLRELKRLVEHTVR